MKDGNDDAAPKNSPTCRREFARHQERCEVNQEGIYAEVKNSDGENNQWNRKKHQDRFNNPVQDSQNQRKSKKREKSFMKIEIWKQEIGAFQRGHCYEKTK